MGSITEAEVCELAADDAGFLWLQRDAATLDPRYKLADLRAADERLEGRLDVLREMGESGLARCLALVEEGGAGEAFVAALLALERGAKDALAQVVGATESSPALGRGVISALGWAPADTARRAIAELLVSDAPPWFRYLGIGGSAVRRSLPPIGPLREALQSEDMRLRARALYAVGELGWLDLVSEALKNLEAEDDEVRYAAAWSAALSGNARAWAAMRTMAEGQGPLAERASAMAVRGMDTLRAGRWIEELGGYPVKIRAALVGAAALGDAAMVPWILKQMESSKTARLAGFALSMITGVDIEKEKLEGSMPAEADAGPNDDPEDENVAPDPDEALPYPDVDAVKAWWKKRSRDVSAGRRLLMGRSIDQEGIEEVLRKGTQPARAWAALERCIRKPNRGLFEVRAKGQRQAVDLGA